MNYSNTVEWSRHPTLNPGNCTQFYLTNEA